MLKYIRAFGFGEKTGIDLPAEQDGMIPESVEDIGEARLATMSYGHGIAVTPIQMVTAVSAVANGGYLLEPYVVDEITDAAGNLVEKHGTVVRRQVVSESTSSTMRNLMVQVVEKGTGKYGAVDRYLIGGKTGTAGKVSETGGYEKTNTSAVLLPSGQWTIPNTRYSLSLRSRKGIISVQPSQLPSLPRLWVRHYEVQIYLIPPA